MPTYEYHCDACDYNFDEFQSIKDAPLKKCPRCSKLKLRRIFGAGSGIIFKGSGFYQTDYRSESYKTAAKKEQESAAPKETGTTATNGKSETTSKKGAAKDAKT